MSLKSWWNSLWEGTQSVDAGIEPGSVNKSVSEPVQTLARLFKENPKRFSFEYETHIVNDAVMFRTYYCKHKHASSCVKVIDSQTQEFWKFELGLYWEAVSDSRYDFRSVVGSFGGHAIYPALGFILTSKPNWLTEDEVEYFKEALMPHFLDRVNRYREIVNYRKERTEESHKRKTELDKKKERQRLVDIYKGE